MLPNLRTSKLPQKDSPLLPVNPLNAGLNPICHLLALLGAHHILHIRRIRAKVVHFILREVYWVSHSVWSFAAPIVENGTKLIAN